MSTILEPNLNGVPGRQDGLERRAGLLGLAVRRGGTEALLDGLESADECLGEMVGGGSENRLGQSGGNGIQAHK